MALQFELMKGSDMTLSRESLNIIRKFRATDKPPVTPSGDYFDFIASSAMSWVQQYAPIYQTPYGILFWNSIKVNENYYALNYEISVAYGPYNHQAGAYQLTVDQSGGTVHVTAGRRIAGYGPYANEVDNGGLIGVDGDEVHGTDIPIAKTKIVVMFRHPGGILNRNYIKSVGRLVGFPNADLFLGYDPGEIRYLGGNFTETQTEASASYSFEVSYNETNFIVGGITIASKTGFDVISPSFKYDEFNGLGVRTLGYIEIIRPAAREFTNYKSIFGWG